MSESQITLFDNIPQDTVEYRTIEGFPGYRVGDDGSVWTAKEIFGIGYAQGVGYQIGDSWVQMQNQSSNPKYYPNVHLYKNGVPHVRTIHRLVLDAFVGPKPPGCLCRHLDGNKNNNHLYNLCWGTYQENEADKLRHGTRQTGESHYNARLKEPDILQIFILHHEGWMDEDIAKEFNLCTSSVVKILARKLWRHTQIPEELIVHRGCRNGRNNVMVTFQGRTQCMSAWAQETGISGGVIRHRLKIGWSVEDTLTIKPKFGKKKFRDT